MVECFSIRLHKVTYFPVFSVRTKPGRPTVYPLQRTNSRIPGKAGMESDGRVDGVQEVGVGG